MLCDLVTWIAPPMSQPKYLEKITDPIAGQALGRETTWANFENPKGPMCHMAVALA